MRKKLEKKKRISPPFQSTDWTMIHNFATAENRSMSDVVREFTLKGMNRDLITTEQLDVIQNIVKEQIEISLEKQIAYLDELQKQTYEAAATSKYLLQFFLSNIKGVDKQLVEKTFQEAAYLANYHLAEQDILEKQGEEEDV